MEVGPQPVLLGILSDKFIDQHIIPIPCLSVQNHALAGLATAVSNTYCCGCDVMWSAMQQGQLSPLASQPLIPFYPIHSPLYQFEMQFHWPNREHVPSSKFRKVSSHPLLGGANSTRTNTVSSYLVDFERSSSFFDLLSDHSIAGEKIFPGAAYLDVCLEHAQLNHQLATFSCYSLQDCTFSSLLNNAHRTYEHIYTHPVP